MMGRLISAFVIAATAAVVACGEAPLGVIPFKGVVLAPGGHAMPSIETGFPVELGRYGTPHFHVYHAMDEGWASAMGEVLEALLNRFLAVSAASELALHPPARKLTWVCFADAAAYESYGARYEGVAAFGRESYYSSRTDCVVFLADRSGSAVAGNVWARGAGAVSPPAIGVGMEASIRMAHEVAHQLAYNTGLQRRGVMYPLWVSEGIATAYETALLAALPIGQVDNPGRRERLVAAQREGRLAPWEDFILMTHAPEDPDVRNDFYAQSWGLVNFLMQADRASFGRYLGVLANLYPGRRPAAAMRREFDESFGGVTALESGWLRYMERLGVE
jgi:hypothetical protein